MTVRQSMNTAARLCAGGLSFGIAAYATYVGVTWLRYGHIRQSTTGDEADPLLDRFMPTYEVDSVTIYGHDSRLDQYLTRRRGGA